MAKKPETLLIPLLPRTSLKFATRPALGVLVLIAVVIRLVSLKYQSIDYEQFLLPWVSYLKDNGFSAFAQSFANYNLPYLYLLFIVAHLPVPAIVGVKLLSILFDFVLAFGVYKLVYHLTHNQKRALTGGIATLFLPTVILNSSVWAQCDSIYVSFLVFSFLYMLKNRQVASWLLWGAAFAFKLQAIFLLPLLAYVWWANKRSAWWAPSLALVTFLAPFIPALVVGRSLPSLLSIYVQQGGLYQALTYNAPSVYQFIDSSAPNASALSKIGILFTAAAVIGLFTLVLSYHAHHKKLTGEWLLTLAVLTSLLIPFLLPHMHERYFYIAEILCLVLATVNTRYIWHAIVVQLVGFIVYVPFLFQTTSTPLPFVVCSLSLLIVITSLSRALFATNNSSVKNEQN